MTGRYAVLRSVRGLTRDPFGGGRLVLSVDHAREAPPAEPRVDLADLRPADVLDLSRDPGVTATAPIMATKLIEPLEVPPSLAMKTAWGVSTIGADRSSFDGSGIVVAVLDTGIDGGHPVFQGVTLVERDFTGSGNGDRHGHGSHCAGTRSAEHTSEL